MSILSNKIGNLVYIGSKRYRYINPFAKSAEWKAIESYANANSYALPTNVDAYDQLIKDLKSAGIWQKLDVFYVFAGNGSNAFKLINWINPNAHHADAYGGLTWGFDGLKGGANGYIDTNYTASVDGVNRQLGSAHIMGVIVQNGRIAWGALSQWFEDEYKTYISYSKRLDGSFNNLGSINQVGFHAIIRTSSEEGLYIHKNNDQALSSTTPQSSLTVYKQSIFRASSNYGSTKFSCWSTGGALTYAETQSFRTIYNNFLTALRLTPIA